MPRKPKTLTLAQIKTCYKHAREHVLEALVDTATEEHHSIITVDPDNAELNGLAHELVMLFIERDIKLIKKNGGFKAALADIDKLKRWYHRMQNPPVRCNCNDEHQHGSIPSCPVHG